MQTESRLDESARLDQLSVAGILRLMSRQDATAAKVVRRQLPAIRRTVDAIVRSFARGGRLVYAGAGTSGRLGVLDASECPPTFGTPPELVQAIIAGGYEACWRAIEGAEDHPEHAVEELDKRGVGPNDIVIGIAASGRTPYVRGAVQEAKRRGAATGAIVCNTGSVLETEVDYPIVLDVGPEVLTGSTRLKSGTAQKMVLNMLSTVSLVKSGRAYGNLMVGLMITSEKLRRRALRILQTELGQDEASASSLLTASGDRLAVAFVMGRCGVDAPAAQRLLEKHHNNIRAVVEKNA